MEALSIFNQDESNIVEKLLLSSLSDYNKVCFFSYNSIKKNNINYKLIISKYNEKKYLIGK